jgi:hypothetical protein
MRRRDFLALSSTLAATTGCLGENESAPGSGTVGLPRNEVDCPFRDNGVEYVVPSDGFGPEEVPIRLERSTETVGLPRGEVSFTLRNGTERVFNTNFYSWGIWKRVDGDWFHVLPRMTNDPLNPMEPGDEHTWTVEVDNGEEVGPVEGTDSVTVRV